MIEGHAIGSGETFGRLRTEILFQNPRSNELIRSAESMASEHPEMAVVTAQIAVEVFVQQALTR